MEDNEKCRSLGKYIELGKLGKTFAWGELKKGCCAPPYQGDCHQLDGVLTLQPDGTGRFDCITFTDHTHSGDIWHATFQLLDADGVALGTTTPRGSSPRMNDGNPPPRYRWGFDLTFDAKLFAQVGQVAQMFAC